jgi:hypothetical protein
VGARERLPVGWQNRRGQGLMDSARHISKRIVNPRLGLMDNARHVNKRTLNPRVGLLAASCDG